MKTQLISRRTRQEFREYFVGTTLREIDDAFGAEGVLCDRDYEPDVPGQRRSLVEQYYHGVDWSDWRQVRPVVQVFESVMIQLEIMTSQDGPQGDYARTQFPALKQWLKKDGLTYEDGRIQVPNRLHDVGQATVHLDAPELRRQIDRMQSSVDSDPGLAIGTAKELVETTCKTILADRGIDADPTWDVPRLVKEVRKTLQLLPSDIDDAAKGSDKIRLLLSNLGTIVNSLAELRNLYGTGHGKHGHAKGVHPRHARLVVGSAATLATFLFETHAARVEREDAEELSTADGAPVASRSLAQTTGPQHLTRRGR